MLTRILFLISLVGSGIFLLCGAWTSSTSTLPQEPEAAFVAQEIPLDESIVGSGIDAGELLQKALDYLDPRRTVWLKTKIRQTMTDADASFVAEGFLQRGPNHCARLELDINTLGKKQRLLVVSDGEVIAQIRETPGADDVAEVTKFPESAGDIQTREKVLVSKCCGGPRTLLESLCQNMKDGRLQSGLLDGMPVIRINGDFEPNVTNICADAKTPVRSAHVYLDAKTLWPVRLEWWGADRNDVPRRVLAMEFLEPEVNRELNFEECVRMFSYRPSAPSRIE